RPSWSGRVVVRAAPSLPRRRGDRQRGCPVWWDISPRLGCMAAGDTYLHRVVAVLNAFRADDDCLGAAELARRSGLPRSTAHRIALELVEAGLLERQGTRVRLGLKLFEIGQRVPRQRVLRDAARSEEHTSELQSRENL